MKPVQTPALGRELGGEVELRGKPLRRTLWIITVAWIFGAVWGTLLSGTPTTLFAQALGASKFQFGLLSAMPFLASLLSLPGSVLIERTGARKRIFFHGLFTQRLMWFPIALVPLWLVHQFGMAGSGPALNIYLIFMFLMYAGQAVGGPAWTSWMADIVPDRARGSYFSRRRQWGILSAVPAALLVGWLLDRAHGSGQTSAYETMRWCAIIFMGAAVFGVLDIAFFHLVPEIPKAPQRGPGLLRAMAEPLRNRQFLLFGGFVGTLVFAVSFMGQFVTLYLIEKIGVTNKGVQMMLLVMPMLAQLLTLPVWGKAVDRMGKKPVLIIAALGLAPVALGWCWMDAGREWLGFALAAAGAALWTGVEVANLNLVLEFAGSPDAGNGNSRGGTSYVAVNSVICNVAGCVGGLAAGVIAQSLKDWTWVPLAGMKPWSFYEILFALSGVMRLLAVVVFLPKLHEPDARPTHEALVYMGANIYNNLFNAIMQPVRYMVKLGGLREEGTEGTEGEERA